MVEISKWAAQPNAAQYSGGRANRHLSPARERVQARDCRGRGIGIKHTTTTTTLGPQPTVERARNRLKGK